MKKYLKVLLLLVVVMLIPITVKAEGTVDEIRVTSTTTSVTEGTLTEFTVATQTEHITIEPFGSNTEWMKWQEGYSSWHGFGTETPTAVADGTTHYSLRLKIDLETGYTFGSNVAIYFNGEEVTNTGHTGLDTGFEWGGYLYIDLGTASAAAVINPDDPGTASTNQKITTVNVTIKAPQIGSKVEMVDHQDEYGAYQWPNLEPTIDLESGANYSCDGTYYITAYPSEKPDGYDEPFIGTFEADKYYYAEVYLVPKQGYEFDDNVTLKVNGSTDNYELSNWNNSGQLMFYAKVKAGTENPKVLEGENQTFKPSSGEQLTFRFDIDYDEFVASGKVYIDGNLVDPKNYTISKGSTIVTFNTAYTNNLSSGNHSVRVTSNNNDITTNFTVATDTNNPKTSDNILTSIIMLLLSGTGLTILLRRKKYE